MIEKRMLRIRWVEEAKKTLADEGYLKAMEEHRKGEEYKAIITRGAEKWKNIMEKINPMLAVVATYENLDKEVFERLCTATYTFFLQTQSYNPPENEMKSIMKISLCNFEVNAEEIMEKYIEAFTRCSRIFEYKLLSEI